MGVPKPPMLDAQATPKNKGASSPARSSSAPSATAKATGKSISVVAVLLIHIESRPEVAMNPTTTRRRDRAPMSRSMPKASRRCAPLRSRAVESINPPNNSKIRSCP